MNAGVRVLSYTTELLDPVTTVDLGARVTEAYNRLNEVPQHTGYEELLLEHMGNTINCCI